MKLSEEERQERGRRLADMLEQLEELKNDKKEMAAGYAKKIKGVQHQIDRLAWSVRTGLLPEEESQQELYE